jgi:hypothetical protein
MITLSGLLNCVSCMLKVHFGSLKSSLRVVDSTYRFLASYSGLAEIDFVSTVGY